MKQPGNNGHRHGRDWELSAILSEIVLLSSQHSDTEESNHTHCPYQTLTVSLSSGSKHNSTLGMGGKCQVAKPMLDSSRTERLNTKVHASCTKTARKKLPGLPVSSRVQSISSVAKVCHTLMSLQSSPLSQHINTYLTALTASFGAFAAFGTAIASLLGDEATTKCGETRHPTLLAASYHKDHFEEYIGVGSELTRSQGSRGCFSACSVDPVAGIATQRVH